MSNTAYTATAAAILTAVILGAGLALLRAMLRHARIAAELGGAEQRADEQRRITAKDAIMHRLPIPITMEREVAHAAGGALMHAAWGLMRQARIRRILRRAFRPGASCIGTADPDRYAVNAVVRTDGVLEIWLMSRNWRTITITSRFHRVHMVHDDQGHLVAAVPAGRLAETVAIMAEEND